MATETPGTHALCKKEATMGRPRKSEPRDRQLNLSLTDSELDGIRRRAEAVGMRPVHFGRAILLDEERAVTRQAAPTGSNLERLIYGQLVRLGNNLNQLVRYLHRTGDPVPADLEPLLNDIRQIIARSMQP
ncbi:MAG: plasmid mobilization relaxosome protein MobC [Alphaproteobacteria bacterium]|nr:plasmid mobilization relaxosome protein MobC [Alphaproteobacteria bacterium]